MKGHILAALREQFESWEQLLSSLDEGEITAPHFDLDWSIKDVVTHLWAWQQISIARVESGVLSREPVYPKWILSIGEGWEDDSDRVNALMFEKNHEKPWSEIIVQNWRSGFLQLRRRLSAGYTACGSDLRDLCGGGARFPSEVVKSYRD